MKKIFLCLLFLTGFESFSQINLDFQSSLMNLYPIKLSNEETKYYLYEQSNLNNHQTFSLYNLDGSLYKTIHMPPKPDTSAFSFIVQYISRTLFDNDSSNIEYLIDYGWDSSYSYPQHEVKVIREDGTILLDEMYGQCFFEGLGVYSTEEGTKLNLSGYYYANGTPFQYLTKVFNLLGKLPNSIDEKFEVFNNNFNLYPNPNNGSFLINFHSKEEEENIIDLYTSSGKLIDTYKSTGPVIHINKTELSEGLYLLNNRTGKLNNSRKMIIKK